MLEHISWKEFFIALGCGCTAYYAILAVAGKIRFNQPKIEYDPSPPIMPTAEREPSDPARFAPVPDPATEDMERTTPEDAAEEEDSEFTELEVLADALQIIIARFATTNGSKDQLLEQLSKEISRYPNLGQTAFQRAISNLIIKASGEECGITITKDEADGCWPGQFFINHK